MPQSEGMTNFVHQCVVDILIRAKWSGIAVVGRIARVERHIRVVQKASRRQSSRVAVQKSAADADITTHSERAPKTPEVGAVIGRFINKGKSTQFRPPTKGVVEILEPRTLSEIVAARAAAEQIIQKRIRLLDPSPGMNVPSSTRLHVTVTEVPRGPVVPLVAVGFQRPLEKKAGALRHEPTIIAPIKRNLKACFIRPESVI